MLEKIKNDLSTAMKNGATETVQTMRYILAEAQQIALKDKRKELNNDDLQNAVSKCIKEGNEGIEIYKNLSGMVAQHNYLRNYRLSEICKMYLPEQLTEQSILLQIKNIISEVNAISVKDMGKVMGKFTINNIKGTFDPKIVSNIIKNELS